MRKLTILCLMGVAGCSEAPSEKAPEPVAATELRPGQWAVATEITQVTASDGGTPVLKTGKMEASHCVGAGEGKKPKPALLSGFDDAECSQDSLYLSNGRLNATLSCTKPSINGKMALGVNGTFTAESFETETSIQTYLPGDGDVAATAKTTARRVGECAPA